MQAKELPTSKCDEIVPLKMRCDPHTPPWLCLSNFPVRFGATHSSEAFGKIGRPGHPALVQAESGLGTRLLGGYQ